MQTARRLQLPLGAGFLLDRAAWKTPAGLVNASSRREPAAVIVTKALTVSRPGRPRRDAHQAEPLEMTQQLERLPFDQFNVMILDRK